MATRIWMCALLLTATNAASAQYVVIDPGHGGSDSGAAVASGCRHGSWNEESVNLDTSERLATALRSRGYRVDLTRTTDTALTLAARAQYANSRGANLFFSIHANSNAGTPATGSETFRHSSKSRTSASGRMAIAIQEALIDTWGLRDRGDKSANFGVLRRANMTAALVELGFMNRCDPDNEYLQSGSHRQRVAEAMAAAIASQLGGGGDTGGGDTGGGDTGGGDTGGGDTGAASCGSGGTCIDTGSTVCAGSLRVGLCPGSSAIRCCEPPPSCGTGGSCINTNTTSCDGTVRTGLCPGGSEIRCCEPPANPSHAFRSSDALRIEQRDPRGQHRGGGSGHSK